MTKHICNKCGYTLCTCQCNKNAELDSPVDRLVIPFGKKVHVTHKYRRRVDRRKKEYVTTPFSGTGIFIGWRTITNGYSCCDYDEGYYWVAEKYIKAALVVFNAKQNPLYIPADCIEV